MKNDVKDLSHPHLAALPDPGNKYKSFKRENEWGRVKV